VRGRFEREASNVSKLEGHAADQSDSLRRIKATFECMSECGQSLSFCPLSLFVWPAI
jgi:hypothetical protein